jgi:PIN domain nuclease of toxin-antitoxin system
LLSRGAARRIAQSDRIGISAISVFEVVELADRGKIELDVPPRRWVSDALAFDRVEPLPLTPEIAVDAAQLRFASDPADRIIYATARAVGARLITRDEKLRAFDPAIAVW